MFELLVIGALAVAGIYFLGNQPVPSQSEAGFGVASGSTLVKDSGSIVGTGSIGAGNSNPLEVGAARNNIRTASPLAQTQQQRSISHLGATGVNLGSNQLQKTLFGTILVPK